VESSPLSDLSAYVPEWVTLCLAINIVLYEVGKVSVGDGRSELWKEHPKLTSGAVT
jgi:hypothetical protein